MYLKNNNASAVAVAVVVAIVNIAEQLTSNKYFNLKSHALYAYLSEYIYIRI